MRVSSLFSRLACQRVARRKQRWDIQRRSIATHPYSHHAIALSQLPTGIDTSSGDYEDNARKFGGVMARLQDLHSKIEQGGSQKAREKHLARGKMLPREYDLEIRFYQSS